MKWKVFAWSLLRVILYFTLFGEKNETLFRLDSKPIITRD
jgi:hypothetical protein